jgi:NitT/TauT family transport system permease protein
VNRFERFALACLGFVAFLALWHCIVIVSEPAPRRPAALGFAKTKGNNCVFVVLDPKQHRILSDTLPLDESKRLEAVEKLRVVLGEHQPTVAAVAPGEGKSGPLYATIQASKTEFGGGLEVREIGAPGSHGAVADDSAASVDDAGQAEARARELQAKRQIRETWLPTPKEAILALLEMIPSGEMFRHIIASVMRVAMGFTLAVALGIPFGLALGSFARVNAFANSLIQVLRPISPIAWLPVATLLFGGGDVAAVYLIWLCSFFPISISTAAAVATVDRKYVRSAMNFGVFGLEFARTVLIPASMPSILTALRVSIGICWVVVVAAEMLGVEQGLGYLVLDARNQLRYDRVVAAMIVIGIIGLLIDYTMRIFERAELERRGLVRT